MEMNGETVSYPKRVYIHAIFEKSKYFLQLFLFKFFRFVQQKPSMLKNPFLTQNVIKSNMKFV